VKKKQIGSTRTRGTGSASVAKKTIKKGGGIRVYTKARVGLCHDSGMGRNEPFLPVQGRKAGKGKRGGSNPSRTRDAPDENAPDCLRRKGVESKRKRGAVWTAPQGVEMGRILGISSFRYVKKGWKWEKAERPRLSVLARQFSASVRKDASSAGKENRSLKKRKTATSLSHCEPLEWGQKGAQRSSERGKTFPVEWGGGNVPPVQGGKPRANPRKEGEKRTEKKRKKGAVETRDFQTWNASSAIKRVFASTKRIHGEKGEKKGICSFKK